MTRMLELSGKDIKTAILTKQRNWKFFLSGNFIFFIKFIGMTLVNKII